MSMEVKNATIEAARIDTERGMLTAGLTLDYGDGGHQGFGGYALYLPKDWAHHGGPNYAGHFIFRCLQVAGADDWAQLVGKTIRVRGNYSSIEAIGHITKNDWFDPRTDFAVMKGQA